MPQVVIHWLHENLHKRRNMNAARIVAGSFGLIILVGALLLSLPIAAKDGQSTNFLTCLFTATSATCVTGLVLVDTWVHWSLFGQVVILGMIQMGGLGFMTLITLISFLMHRRIGLSERLVMVSALNLNDIDGVVRVVRHALMGTFLLEGVGAVILSACFIPRFGWAGGIWRGVFHAVSAFCNAGFDTMGAIEPGSSLTHYADQPVVLFTIMTLIVIGGLGFFVWEDVLRARKWKGLSLYSKMVIGITAFLIFSGTLFFAVSEWQNGGSFGNMPPWQKLLNAMFQSVTLRTAGFNTVPQGEMQEASLALGCVFMLIGGSSGSTAGGIKTVTAGILLLTFRAGLKGREHVNLRGRQISQRQVMNAMTLALMVGCMFMVGALAITMLEGIPFLHGAFEAASALGTVGLSTGITPFLEPVSQMILIYLMFIGRVGVMSFSMAFTAKHSGLTKVKYPTVNIMIG